MKNLARMRWCPRDPCGATRARGFTLIELMVVVGVAAVLSALAYPSYVAYIQRANRAGAKTALQEVAQYMERQFTVNNKYPVAAEFPDMYKFAPLQVSTAQRKYVVTLSTTGTPATTFILTATPNDAKVDPTCGTFRLDNVGNQRAKDHAVSDSLVADDTICWQK
jgi:type IV pilus assembly protein PilE